MPSHKVGSLLCQENSATDLLKGQSDLDFFFQLRLPDNLPYNYCMCQVDTKLTRTWCEKVHDMQTRVHPFLSCFLQAFFLIAVRKITNTNVLGKYKLLTSGCSMSSKRRDFSGNYSVK